MKKGTLYYITGLSGAGKTTIGTMLYNFIREKKSNVVFLDGDILREVYANTDYTPEGREKVAYQNLRLCRMLVNQGIDVVGCFIGMYDRYREWSRENIENYIEIYLKVSIEELIRRDAKGLYKKALAGEIKNVYGIDMPYEEPKTPNIVIYNEGTIGTEDAVRKIIEQFVPEDRL